MTCHYTNILLGNRYGKGAICTLLCHGNVVSALSLFMQLVYPKYASQAVLQILQQDSDISTALMSAYPYTLPDFLLLLSASFGSKQCSTAYLEQWPHDRARKTRFCSTARFAVAHPEHS